MTTEEIIAEFAKFDEEYLRFEAIPEPERLHASMTLCCYLKVASLMKNPGDFDVSASHDIVYLPDLDDLDAEKVTAEDVRYLVRCGVMIDSEHGCLAHFC